MALYPHSENGYWEYGSTGFPVVGGFDDSVIENFETQSLAPYSGNTGSFRIQGSSVLQGRYSLESTAESVVIGNNGSAFPTPRTSSPTEYRARLLQSSNGYASIMSNVQSSAYPWRNCYALLVDIVGDEIRLLSRESNTTRYLERKSVSGLSTNTEYRPAINLTDEGIKGRLYDRNDNLLAETESYRDTTHTGGGIGWMNGPGVTAYYDYYAVGPGTMGNVSRVVLNDFEDGSLGEYYVVGGGSSGDQYTSPASAYAGNYGLEMVDYGAIQTVPGMDAPGYLRDGHPISFRFKPRAIGNEQYGFYFAMPTAGASSNLYKLEFIMPSSFRLQVNNGSGDFTVSGSSSQNDSYAACYNLSNYSTGTWYQIVLDVDSSDGIRADMYYPSGSRKAWLQSSHTTHIDPTMGYGHYCSGGGHVFYDEIIEHIA